MKKIGKITLIVVIISAILLALTACGEQNEQESGSRNENQENQNGNEAQNENHQENRTANNENITPAQIFAANQFATIIIRGVCSQGYEYTGSGFFICSTGIAVTNHHVMDGIVEAVAFLYDDRGFDIVGYFSYDFENDLAVIQVDGQGEVFEYVTLGNSDGVRVGDDVFAIGGPDWDPITFTPGMVSRIATEPIAFDIYSVEGMFQSTAAIYGGNSGGPLVNNRGEVIGINAAGSNTRASVQFAVPANRITLHGSGDTVNPLPVGGGAAFVTQHPPGEVFYLARFPFITDFLSVSPNAMLSFSGTPADLGLSAGDIIYDYYAYLFIYCLYEEFWEDLLTYEDILYQYDGFYFQDEIDFDDEVWVYFYNPELSVSLSYAVFPGYDEVLIALVDGNVFEAFYG